MKNTMKIAIAILLSLTITTAQGQRRSQNKPDSVTILKNINIVDVENKTVCLKMDIAIEKGLIKEVGKNITASGEHEREIDMTGKYAMPGIIDAHVHIANSTQWTRQMGVEDLRYLVEHGVTSVRDVGGDARLLAEWKRAIDINDIIGPDIYYSVFMATRDYYGTPNTDRAMTGGMDAEFAPWAQLVNPGDDLDAVMIAAKATGATGVKIYLGYDKEFLKEMVSAARKHGLEAWSHSMLFPAKPSEVAQAGVKVLSHAYMFEWENVENVGKNSSEAYKNYNTIDRTNINIDEFVRQALANDAILDATLFISFENDMDFVADITKKVYQAGVKVSAGTDWIIDKTREFPPIFDEIDYLIDRCGFSNIDALCAATIIAAETFAGQNKTGSIVEGKQADIVILNGNPVEDIKNIRKIDRVIKNGKFIKTMEQ